MCGICGIFHYGTGAPVDRRELVTMRECMAHRGPDDKGDHVDGAFGFGARRLAIIDVAGGRQPFAAEDELVWAMHNGEIYNFRELRRELEAYGHVFRTRSDGEVVVHATEQWGFEALRRLNGMFGLATWDARQQQLVLARDPFGVKPLYVWDDGATFLFASEIRSILAHPLVRPETDVNAIASVLAYGYVPSPYTAFRGIQKLPPGHAIVLTLAQRPKLVPFHDSPPLATARDVRELVDELQTGIHRAIVHQLVADVPIGVMLSGGIDSTAIAGIAAAEADRPLRTFTVGFAGERATNELAAARATARRLGTEHVELSLTQAHFFALLPRAVAHLEEPVANPSAVPFLALCDVASQSVKVALSGQGADEAFAGYGRYAAERFGGLYRAVPGALRERVIAPSLLRLPRNERIKRGVRSLGVDDASERLRLVRSIADVDVLQRVLAKEAVPYDPFSLWEQAVAKAPSLDRMLYVDARTSLSDDLLLFTDKMGMAASLEVRVPFLDLELMRLAESIPASRNVAGRTGKRLLREAVSAWVPADVRARKKIGFVTPVDRWLKDEVTAIVEERLLDAASFARSCLDTAGVRGLLREHQLCRHDHKRVLFALLVLAYWRPPCVGWRAPVEAAA